LRGEKFIKNLGFIKVGEWKLKVSGDKKDINFQLKMFEKERAIYAFVVDHEVKYIGICDSDNTTLKDRMRRYKYKQGGSTNARINDEIKNCLLKQKQVEIFALKPKEQYTYKSLNIDLIKGLENPLIKELDPEWNIQSKS